MPSNLPRYTRPQVGELIGVHSQSVVRLERESGLPCAEKGAGGRASKYDPAEVVAWWVKHRLTQATGGEHNGGWALNPHIERARKDRAQAQLAEQMLATRAGQLVALPEVKAEWDKKVGATRTRLNAIPRAVAEEVERMARSGAGPAAIEAFLRGKVREALAELAGLAAER